MWLLRARAPRGSRPLGSFLGSMFVAAPRVAQLLKKATFQNKLKQAFRRLSNKVCPYTICLPFDACAWRVCVCVSLISLREQQKKTTVGLPIIHTHIPTLFSVTNALFFKFLFHSPSLSSSFSSLAELGAAVDQQARMEHQRGDSVRLRRPHSGARQMGLGRCPAARTCAHPHPRLQHR